MTGRVRLDRGELPWPPLAPGGDGLNRYPQAPVALERRMAEVYGVPDGCVLAVAGADLALDLLREVTLPVANERAIELTAGTPRASEAARGGLLVIRDLAAPYALAGAPCAAIIGSADAIAALRAALPVWAVPPTPTQRLALAVLDGSRLSATQARWMVIRTERERLCLALGCAAGEDGRLILEDAEPAAFARFGVEVEWFDGTTARVTVGTPEENDLVLAAMGVSVPPRSPARRAEVVRDTKETKIVCTVDLDRAGPQVIATGIGFYDHMLEQVAKHGGFACTLSCEGDLHIEAHHTIEDAALALGEALRQALGDRAGVARFGFVAPLDEAEAAVTLDLSGRPLAKFTGAFKRPMIGDYPTEMTAHVFRSLADSMRATIHVKVEGEDDHHKTEAAFKAFGRALRQAVKREGEGVPSTKGVLA